MILDILLVAALVAVSLSFLHVVQKKDDLHAKERNLLLTRIQAPEKVPLDMPKDIEPSEYVPHDDDKAFWESKGIEVDEWQ